MLLGIFLQWCEGQVASVNSELINCRKKGIMNYLEESVLFISGWFRVNMPSFFDQ